MLSVFQELFPRSCKCLEGIATPRSLVFVRVEKNSELAIRFIDLFPKIKNKLLLFIFWCVSFVSLVETILPNM